MATTKPKEVSVLASSPVAGMKATKLEYQAVEDEQEKALRLHKERINFYLKEVLPWGLAMIFISGAWAYSLWMILKNEASSAEKDRAWTIFTSITSAAAGILFGKQLGGR